MTGDAKFATHPQSKARPALQFKTLGRYTILRELGRGGMGAVYLAEDKKLERNVALKIPQFEPHKAEQMQARFIREAKMAAKLSHPNICQVYDVDQIDGQYVMTMEYIEGHTLAEHLGAGKKFGEQQAVQLIRKIALALEYAHQRGLIHRDLKPANIMLPKPDPGRRKIEPQVMDFGLAKSLSADEMPLTQSGMIVGTPCYMSKEQWSGKDVELTTACDVYSLGVILYELLAGAFPFVVDPGSKPVTWFAKMVTEPPIPVSRWRPGIDSRLEAIVMRAIAVEVPNRYATMAEFATALDGWVTEADATEPQTRNVHSSDSVLSLQGLGGAPTSVNVPVTASLSAETPYLSQARTLLGDVIRKSGTQGWKKWTLWGGGGLLGVIILLFIINDDPSAPQKTANAVSSEELAQDWADYRRASLRSTGSDRFFLTMGRDHAEKWRSAAESGDSHSMILFGRCVELGVGATKNEVEAIRWYRKSAALGEPIATTHLGIAYFYGKGLAADKPQGIRYFTEAAEKGEPLSQWQMGRIYENGDGVSKDVSKSLEFYDKAINGGVSRAIVSKGRCYLTGTGVPVDPAKALELFRNAANAGDPEGTYYVGYCYDFGSGVEKDPKQAAVWYRKAADLGASAAVVRVATGVTEGDAMFDRNPLEAVKPLRQIRADLTGSGGWDNSVDESYARCFLRCGQDDLAAGRPQEAREHLTEALTVSQELNERAPRHFYFMQDLGRIWYELGNLERSEKSYSAAVVAYQKSMSIDGPEMTLATKALAEMHERGEGMSQDKTEAERLRSLHAAQKIKKFTVPVKIYESDTTTFPLDVYIFEKFNWLHPLETQARYFKDQRGIEIPKDVMDSFDRLWKISKENNVSFTDLCVYALGDNDKEKGADPKPEDKK